MDQIRVRDFTLFSLSLSCSNLRIIYQPILLKDVTLQIDHIGSFLSFLSKNSHLADQVETLTFTNLSASRRFPSKDASETIQEAALRIWKRSGQKCMEASHSLLQMDSEEEDEDNDDNNTLTPRHFRKENSFKTSLLYIYYAKGAIIESLKNLRCLKDETYVVFPFIRRGIWDSQLAGLQSLKRLIVEQESYDSYGNSVSSTRGRNMIWCLLFLPSLKQAKFKIGMDYEDMSYLEDNLPYYNQASQVKELIVDFSFIPKDTKNAIWNTKLMVENVGRILLTTKALSSLDLTISSFSIPDFFSCLKNHLSSSFNTLQNLKLRGDPKKNLSYLVPEFSGRPTLTYFTNLQTLTLDSDFILSLQVSKDGIPMPSKRSSIDGIMRLADKMPLEPIKLRRLTTLTVLSNPNSSLPNSLSSSISSLNSSSSSFNSTAAKKKESVLKTFISEHHLTPNLRTIQLQSNPDPSSPVFALERRSSTSKSGRKSSSSLETLSVLCERKNLALKFLEPGRGGESEERGKLDLVFSQHSQSAKF